MATKQNPESEEEITDENVIVGHPATGGDPDGAEEPVEEPKAEEPKKEEEKLDVDAIREQLREELREELKAELRPREEPKKPDEYDWENELIANPKEAVNRLREEIRNEFRQEIEKEKKQLTAKQAEDNFWAEFYKENDDLDRKHDHKMVKAVLDENLDTFSKIKDPAKLAGKLADETRKAILAYSKRSSGKKPPQVEGANSGRTEAPKKDEPRKVVSLADTLAQRRKSRREATRKAG